jgi:hypothetical protein
MIGELTTARTAAGAAGGYDATGVRTSP